MVAAIAPQQIDLAHYRLAAAARKAFKASAFEGIIPGDTDFSACAARRIGEFSAKRLVTFSPETANHSDGKKHENASNYGRCRGACGYGRSG
jgi:hypothetical protein